MSKSPAFYLDIYDKYEIICNNTVYGGDCYGQTMCVCKCFLYDLKYLDYHKDTDDYDCHHDFFCNTCNIKICGCCYHKCVICDADCWNDEPTNITILSNPKLPRYKMDSIVIKIANITTDVSQLTDDEKIIIISTYPLILGNRNRDDWIELVLRSRKEGKYPW